MRHAARHREAHCWRVGPVEVVVEDRTTKLIVHLQPASLFSSALIKLQWVHRKKPSLTVPARNRTVIYGPLATPCDTSRSLCACSNGSVSSLLVHALILSTACEAALQINAATLVLVLCIVSASLALRVFSSIPSRSNSIISLLTRFATPFAAAILSLASSLRGDGIPSQSETVLRPALAITVIVASHLVLRGASRISSGTRSPFQSGLSCRCSAIFSSRRSSAFPELSLSASC